MMAKRGPIPSLRRLYSPRTKGCTMAANNVAEMPSPWLRTNSAMR